MHVYILVDMEGVAGVVDWKETASENREYQRFRRLMTAEADAAVRGAFDAGANSVLVNDAHGGMRNLMIEELDPRAELVSGSPKAASMVEGLDRTTTALIMIGTHAMAGTRGVLNHTYTRGVLRYTVNECAFGEIGMCTALAGYYGVPLVFASGDDYATREAAELVPGVATVTVKRARGRQAARSLHPVLAREHIRAGVRSALAANQVQPLQISAPVHITLQFTDSTRADAHHYIPGTRRLDALTVSYQARDYEEAYRVSRGLMMLAELQE